MFLASKMTVLYLGGNEAVSHCLLVVLLFIVVEDVFGDGWEIAAFLCFQDDGSAFEGFDAVPHANFDHHSGAVGAGFHIDAVGDVPVVVIEILNAVSPQHHDGFGRVSVSVYWQDGAGFQGVEHTLRLDGFGAAKVVVHAESR